MKSLNLADRVVILGASGHGKVVADTFRASGVEVLGFLDATREKGSEWSGYPVLGNDDDLEELMVKRPGCGFFVAIGDNNLRREITQRILNTHPRLQLHSCVHPSAYVAPDVIIEDGVAVFAGAIIQPGSALGKGSLVNTGASLDHDGRLGDFSSLAPGVVTGGNVALGLCSAVSLGAHIKHGVRIGAHTVIGAGAVVMDDMEDEVVAYGVPAKVIRKRKRGEAYL